MQPNTECQRPSCSNSASESWRGEQGNSVDVCEECYWKLVTGSVNSASASLEVPHGPMPSPLPNDPPRYPQAFDPDDLEPSLQNGPDQGGVE